MNSPHCTSLALISAVWIPAHIQGLEFVLNTNFPDKDMLDINDVLHKENYGALGLSKYCKNMACSTALLTQKFGVGHHNVVSCIVDGEEGDHLCLQHVQQVIVGMLHHIHQGHQCSKAMVFMDICLVTKLDGNLECDHCHDWWDNSEVNNWTNWDSCNNEQK